MTVPDIGKIPSRKGDGEVWHVNGQDPSILFSRASLDPLRILLSQNSPVSEIQGRW